MKLLKLTLEGFRSWSKKTVFDFSSLKAVVITGANGSGKSCIPEALEWAIWGKHRTKDVDSVITRGADVCTVELVFEIRGCCFEIKRARGKSSVLVLKRDGVQISGKSIRETQSLIDDALGVTRDSFLSMAILRNGSSGSFCGSDDTQRRAYLRSLLGLDRYEDARREAVKLGNTAKKEAIDLAASRPDDRLEYVNGRILVTEAELKVLNGKLKSSQADVDTAQKALGEAAELIEAQTRRDGIQNQIDAIDRQGYEEGDVDHIKSDKRRWAGKLDFVKNENSITILEARIVELRGLQEDSRISHTKYNNALNWCDERMIRYGSEPGLGGSYADGLRSRIEQLNSSIFECPTRENARSAHKTAVTNLSRAKNAVIQNEAREQNLKMVPFGEKCLTSGCPFVNQSTIDDFSISVEAAGLGVVSTENLLKSSDTRARVEAQLLEIESVIEHLVRFDAMERPVQYDCTELDGAASDLSDERQRVADIIEKSMREQSKLDHRIIQAERWAARIKLMDELGVVPGAGRVNVGSLRAAVGDASAIVRRLNTDVNATSNALAGLRVELVEEVKQNRRALDIDTKLVGLHAEQELCTHAALVAQLAPTVMIETFAIPTIEFEANEVLARITDGMSVRIDTQRETKGGDTTEALSVWVNTPTGPSQYEELSAGEMFRVNIAFSLAQGKLMANNDAHIDLLIIDEGFGTLDDAGTEAIGDVITRLQTMYSTMIVISHIKSVAECLPVKLRVEKLPEGSFLHRTG